MKIAATSVKAITSGVREFDDKSGSGTIEFRNDENQQYIRKNGLRTLINEYC